VSTEQFLRSLQPHERSYYDDIKKLSLENVERQLAALLIVQDRFLGTARVESYMFCCSCILICQQVIIEIAAQQGRALSTALLTGIQMHASLDHALVCDVAQSLSASMAMVIREIDPELDARIARHRALAAYDATAH
jgi:hypothetical protein